MALKPGDLFILQENVWQNKSDAHECNSVHRLYRRDLVGWEDEVYIPTTYKLFSDCRPNVGIMVYIGSGRSYNEKWSRYDFVVFVDGKFCVIAGYNKIPLKHKLINRLC